MDELARSALDAYERTIRVYRNPYRDAPEFSTILRYLHDADEYYSLIPQFEMKPDQIFLAGKVRSILIKWRH